MFTPDYVRHVPDDDSFGPASPASTPLTKMVRARAELVLAHPFFAALALRLTLVEDRSVNVAACDGVILAYNPDRVVNMDVEFLAGVLGHEVLHIACGHHMRRMGRDPHLWNMACDYAINWICLEAGLKLPPGYLDDRKLRDLSVEDIYARLLSQKGQEMHGGAEAASLGEETSQAPDDAPAQSEFHGEKQDTQKAPADSREQNDDESSEDDQGQASKGRPGQKMDPRDEPSDQGHADQAGTGEVLDAPGGSGSGREQARQADELLQMLARAEMAVRNMGDLPAGLKRILGQALHPPLPWREILSRFVTDNARNDFSWIPPNRRYLHMGLHLPGLSNMELPCLVLALDTSGSVSKAELDAFAVELNAIIQDFDTVVHLIHCDSEVAGHQILTRSDLPLSITPKGGGGTDYRPAFNYVRDQALDPACMIYLTDMQCNRFPESPDYPVLWACTAPGPHQPPFGEVLVMNRQQETTP